MSRLIWIESVATVILSALLYLFVSCATPNQSVCSFEHKNLFDYSPNFNADKKTMPEILLIALEIP